MKKRNWILLIAFTFILILIALKSNNNRGYLEEFRNSNYDENQPIDSVRTGVIRW